MKINRGIIGAGIVLAGMSIVAYLKADKQSGKTSVAVRVDSTAIRQAAEAKRIASAIHIDDVAVAMDYVGNVDLSQYKGAEASAIIGLCNSLDEYAALAKQPVSDSSSVKRKELGRQIVAFRKQNMPTLRKYWAESAGNSLWEHNIEVDVLGSRRDVLVFTGGTYASNASIKETQVAVSEATRLLRFKQVRYKWYSGDDEYTYYTLKPPGDGEL